MSADEREWAHIRDAGGYEARPRDLTYVSVTPEDIRQMRARGKPLGFKSTEQWEQCGVELWDKHDFIVEQHPHLNGWTEQWSETTGRDCNIAGFAGSGPQGPSAFHDNDWRVIDPTDKGDA